MAKKSKENTNTKKNETLDEDDFDLWLSSSGHDARRTDAGPRRDYLSATSPITSDFFMENTLTRISGDDKDANYEWKFTLPTDLLPSIKQDDMLIDSKQRKGYQISLDIEDVSGHSQYYYLYPWDSTVEGYDGFEVINENFEHELPKVTVTYDKASVDVTDEAQDMTMTIDWTDESGVNLQTFLDRIDENGDGIIGQDGSGDTPFFYTYIQKEYVEDGENLNYHYIRPNSISVNDELTNDNRAVVELGFTIPKGYIPTDMNALVQNIYDTVDNGGNGFKYDGFQINSATETNPPAFELISVSQDEVDVTNGPVDVTVRFRITDESGIEERNLDSREDSNAPDGFELPGMSRDYYWENRMNSSLEKDVCTDTLYLERENPQAFWFFRTQDDDPDDDGTNERFGYTYFNSDPSKKTSELRVEGDVNNGIYETVITVEHNAYPGLYMLELDNFNDGDDIHGNFRFYPNADEWEPEDRVAGSDVYPKRIRVINTNHSPPEED